jgi:cytochrome c-type biogenesis protein CcmI
VATWIAAIMLVAAVALFVAAPLTEGFFRRRGATLNDLERDHLEHDRGLAVQGLRELEFDHEMGKLDEADYQSLRKKLEARALAAMSAIERTRGQSRGTLRLAPRRSKPAADSTSTAILAARRVNFCPQCGVRVGAGHNFCAECGASLAIGAGAASRAE